VWPAAVQEEEGRGRSSVGSPGEEEEGNRRRDGDLGREAWAEPGGRGGGRGARRQ
jgi:hypothetical protein